MANTQKANGEAKRTRRSPEERHTAMLQQQRTLAEKSRERAERLAKQAAEAQRKAKEAQERIEKIAKIKPVTPKPKTQVANADASVKQFAKEFKDFLDQMSKKYGFNIEATTPKLVKRGFISAKIKADLMPTLIPIGVRPSNVVARETGRFIHHYKDVGLQPNLLNKEVTVSGDKFVVAGLRGKGHNVVLLKPGSNESFIMAAEDFKRSVAA